MEDEWRKGQAHSAESFEAPFAAELLTAPKKGFGVPLGRWFRGPLRELIRDTLTSTEFHSRGIAHRSNVIKMLDEHDSARRDHSAFLWQLLVLELWFRDRASAGEMPRSC